MVGAAPPGRAGVVAETTMVVAVALVWPGFGLAPQRFPHALLGWADHVLIAQKPSPEILARLEKSGRPLIDLVGALDSGR